MNNTPLLDGCQIKFDINEANSIFGSVEINASLPIKPEAILKKGKSDFLPYP